MWPGVALITAVKCSFPWYLKSYACSNVVRQVYDTAREAKESTSAGTALSSVHAMEQIPSLKDSPEGSSPASNSI